MATDHRKAFIKLFLETAKYHHRYQVFRDFVTMAAISIQNSMIKSDVLEKEYLDIVGRYEKEDVHRMPKLLGEVVMGLDAHFSDFLGSVFMELEIGSNQMGQFFTPYHASKLIATLLYGDSVERLVNSQGFITVSEPACGAGGMVIAFAETMLEKKLNPQQQMWVSCIDVDPVAAYMCYIQLSLLHIPAEVVIGNALSMRITRVLRTPAHFMGFWDSKLKTRGKGAFADLESVIQSTEPETSRIDLISDEAVKPIATPKATEKRPVKEQMALFDFDLTV